MSKLLCSVFVKCDCHVLLTEMFQNLDVASFWRYKNVCLSKLLYIAISLSLLLFGFRPSVDYQHL